MPLNCCQRRSEPLGARCPCRLPVVSGQRRSKDAVDSLAGYLGDTGPWEGPISFRHNVDQTGLLVRHDHAHSRVTSLPRGAQQGESNKALGPCSHLFLYLCNLVNTLLQSSCRKSIKCSMSLAMCCCSTAAFGVCPLPLRRAHAKPPQPKRPGGGRQPSFCRVLCGVSVPTTFLTGNPFLSQLSLDARSAVQRAAAAARSAAASTPPHASTSSSSPAQQLEMREEQSLRRLSTSGVFLVCQSGVFSVRLCIGCARSSSSL